MSEVKQIVYKGKKIFLADHVGSQGDEVLRGQNSMLERIKQSGITDALSVTDMTNVYTPPGVHNEMKRIGTDILKYSKKAAVVGMTKGAKRVLINMFMKMASKPMALFENLDEAKEWLVKD